MTRLGGVIACEDGSLRPATVIFGNRIEAVDWLSGPRDGDLVLPGFIDLQVNGGFGINVAQASAEDLARLAEALTHGGTTSFLAALITAPLDRIQRADATVVQAMDAEAESGECGSPAAAILGVHLEGPFISPRCLGIHPALNLEPRGDALEHVLGLKAVRLLTIAPELDGACDAIRRLVVRGVVVSLGHSYATADEAERALAAGARMFTHLFNAMRPLHHRDPGIVGAALRAPSAMVAVIADGVHVHPELLQIVYRLRGADGIILTTDRVDDTRSENQAGAAAAGAVFDGVRLAGSTISMLDAVRTMVRRVGVPIGEVARMAAGNPARVLGLDDRGRIAVGARADLLVISRALELKAVFIGGREVQL